MVAMLCALIASLVIIPVPAQAFAIYEAFVQASVSAPGPLPSGTSISFLPGSTFTSGGFLGNALATNAASSAPGSASALATGVINGPGDAQANSFAQAVSEATLQNLNTTAVTLPLTFSHSRSVNASTIPFGGQSEFVNASAFFQILFDNNLLLENFSSPCSGISNCNTFDSGSDAFLFGLTPGSHSLKLVSSAFGSALTQGVPPDPVPEPTTLLLVGTTMAGLGLARLRRWRKKQP